jgi:hypothetical protein
VKNKSLDPNRRSPHVIGAPAGGKWSPGFMSYHADFSLSVMMYLMIVGNGKCCGVF